MRGFSHYDRQLRNDILVITTIIAQNPEAPMIVSMIQITLILIVEVVGVGERSPILCCNICVFCCNAKLCCNIMMVTSMLITLPILLCNPLEIWNLPHIV